MAVKTYCNIGHSIPRDPAKFTLKCLELILSKLLFHKSEIRTIGASVLQVTIDYRCQLRGPRGRKHHGVDSHSPTSQIRTHLLLLYRVLLKKTFKHFFKKKSYSLYGPFIDSLPLSITHTHSHTPHMHIHTCTHKYIDQAHLPFQVLGFQVCIIRLRFDLSSLKHKVHIHHPHEAKPLVTKLGL